MAFYERSQSEMRPGSRHLWQSKTLEQRLQADYFDEI